ncbi:MAG: hypothetical protein AAFZ65_09400 [Planctomycetota bacterium]
MHRLLPSSFLALLVFCISTLGSTAAAAPQAMGISCGDSKDFHTTKVIKVTGTGTGGLPSALRAAYEQLESHPDLRPAAYTCGDCAVQDGCEMTYEFLPGNKPKVSYPYGPVWSVEVEFTGEYRVVCTSCTPPGTEPPTGPPALETLECGQGSIIEEQIVITVDMPYYFTPSQADYGVREAVKKKLAELSGLGCSYCIDPEKNFKCRQRVRFLDADPTIVKIEKTYNGYLQFTVGYVGTSLVSCDLCPQDQQTSDTQE